MNGGKILALDTMVSSGVSAGSLTAKGGGHYAVPQGPRSFLLLQGPVGPFFRQLARRLRRQGYKAHKVAFWGGDLIDLPTGLIFRGDVTTWAAWLRDAIARYGITDLVMFGDERPYHKIARGVAQELGLNALVFEEGYLRPNFVTLDLGGANGNSSITERLAKVLRAYRLPQRIPRRREEPVGTWIPQAVACVMKHYAAGLLAYPLFSRYHHHRLEPISREAAGYVRHWLTRRWRQRDARKVLLRLRELTGRRYFFPLQMDNDAQLRVHSSFKSMTGAIHKVMASFAQHAPADAHLIIKPHPLDFGAKAHQATVEALVRELQLQGRVHWIDGAATKDLILMSQGVVTVNSTTGLQALYHGRPVKALGVALWDAPSMTHQGSLDDFWWRPEWPNASAVKRFRFWLWRETQINGNFYSRRGRRLALDATVERLTEAPGRRAATVELWTAGRLAPLTAGLNQGVMARS